MSILYLQYIYIAFQKNNDQFFSLLRRINKALCRLQILICFQKTTHFRPVSLSQVVEGADIFNSN